MRVLMFEELAKPLHKLLSIRLPLVRFMFLWATLIVNAKTDLFFLYIPLSMQVIIPVLRIHRRAHCAVAVASFTRTNQGAAELFQIEFLAAHFDSIRHLLTMSAIERKF